MRRLLVMLACLAGCTMQSRSDRLVPHPAQWQSSDALRPRVGDYDFAALAFVPPERGWIVGNRFALRIEGDDIAVAFLRPHDLSLSSIGFDSERHGIVGGTKKDGYGAPTDIILRQQADGSWHREPVHSVSPDSSVWRVAAGSGDSGSAISIGVIRHDGTMTETRSVLLKYGADGWSSDASSCWRPVDLCAAESGPTWMIGREIVAQPQPPRRRALPSADAPAAPQMVAAVQRAGVWQESPLPVNAAAGSVLLHAACAPDGVAVAGRTGDASGHSEALLLRHAATWEVVPLPEEFRSYTIEALAARSVDDLWLAVNCVGAQCRPRFLHWSAGQWSISEPPVLPGGRRDGYVVVDMQFVAPNEGWAIANDTGGPDLSRGLIFHYRDGVWRNRNWDWNFWDQPGFGWFGD